MAPELLVQISDPHLRVGDEQAAQALQRAVAAIARIEPAPPAVLVTGDLADHGDPEEYALVRELLAPLGLPLHVIPGNHDDRDALREAFADQDGLPADGEFVQYAFDSGSLRVIACDTSVPGEDGGRLGPERLAWLEGELQAADGRSTLLAMHHPPISTGVRWLDRTSLAEEDRAALGELVAAAPWVERIVCGHIHRTALGTLGDLPVFTCPSTNLQALLDLREHGVQDIIPEPPAIAVHVHGVERRLITHVQPT